MTIFLATALVSCSSRDAASPHSTPHSPESPNSKVQPWTPGAPVFGYAPFSIEQVTEFTLSVTDPRRDSPWTARLVRDPDAKFIRRSFEWMFAPGSTTPDGTPLADRLADRNYVNHLFDGIIHVNVIDPLAERTSDPDRQSVGLSPALYRLRFLASGRQYELHIGGNYKNPAKPESTGVIVEIVSPEPKGERRIGVVNPVVLRLLEALPDYQALRQRTLSTFRADDVFEIEWTPKNAASGYAQREGSVWTDRGHLPVKNLKVADALETWAGASAASFIENPSEVSRLKKALETPDLTLRLTERKGKVLTITARYESAAPGQTPSTHAIVSTSDRPEVVFRANASFMRAFGVTTDLKSSPPSHSARARRDRSR